MVEDASEQIVTILTVNGRVEHGVGPLRLSCLVRERHLPAGSGGLREMSE